MVDCKETLLLLLLAKQAEGNKGHVMKNHRPLSSSCCLPVLADTASFSYKVDRQPWHVTRMESRRFFTAWMGTSQKSLSSMLLMDLALEEVRDGD